MSRKQRRLSLIGAAFAVIAVAVALVLFALKDSIVFFNSPTELVEKQIKPGQRVRIQDFGHDDHAVAPVGLNHVICNHPSNSFLASVLGSRL